MKKFYLTTPIYYVNDKPHIGHTYTTVVADTLARFHRLLGEDVRLVTGTDENSQKNVQAMEKAGEKDINAYLDRMSGEWRKTWTDLGISIDDFIRTTEARHLAGVERFWNAVKKGGDIYEGEYEGWYCSGCEAFKTESEIANGRCILHPNRELEHIKEKNYFFKLTAYREDLLKLYERPDFVMPEARRNEIRNYVKDHLADVSVSREASALPIGIPVPGDDSQRIYVWFDALLNYMTAVGYGTDDDLFEQYWPADLHLVGKDIIKFHCALWPAMLMSAAKNDKLLRNKDGSPKLPTQVYAHGFFTIDGQKISKSLGNAVDPRELIPTYGFDAVRYYLLREIPFGEDGDFSRERLAERYTSDLGNTLGNLVNRAVAMSRKYFDGKVPDAKPKKALLEGVDVAAENAVEAYRVARCDQALVAIWASVASANKYIEDMKPFKLIKEDPEKTAEVLYAVLEACRWYAWLIRPALPETSDKIFVQLGLEVGTETEQGWKKALRWGGLEPGTNLPEPKPLFPRLGESE